MSSESQINLWCQEPIFIRIDPKKTKYRLLENLSTDFVGLSHRNILAVNFFTYSWLPKDRIIVQSRLILQYLVDRFERYAAPMNIKGLHRVGKNYGFQENV